VHRADPLPPMTARLHERDASPSIRPVSDGRLTEALPPTRRRGRRAIRLSTRNCASGVAHGALRGAIGERPVPARRTRAGATLVILHIVRLPNNHVWLRNLCDRVLTKQG
jgi:hypothetical protein